MEEFADGSCSVVYFASARDGLYELYHKSSPPEIPSETRPENGSLDNIYQNVRTLLDEDQGGFDEGNVVDVRESLGTAVLTAISLR